MDKEKVVQRELKLRDLGACLAAAGGREPRVSSTCRSSNLPPLPSAEPLGNQQGTSFSQPLAFPKWRWGSLGWPWPWALGAGFLNAAAP